MIARCPACNTNAPVVERENWIKEDGNHVVFAPHGECKGGAELAADLVYPDIPSARASLDLRFADGAPCSSCLRLPAVRRNLCRGCFEAKTRRVAVGGRR